MFKIVKKELELLANDENYYGSKIQIEMEKMIIKFAFKDCGIEMKYNEAIEEFYNRVSEAYKKLIKEYYNIK